MKLLIVKSGLVLRIRSAAMMWNGRCAEAAYIPTKLVFILCSVIVLQCLSHHTPPFCLFPPGSHTKYATSFCWVRNTYYVPLDERLPKPDEPREHVIPYYQWVPFILLIQALFFYLPSAFWHGLNQKGRPRCKILQLETKRVTVR